MVDDRELDEALVSSLLRTQRGPVDPNLIAAYVDGGLDEDERARVASQIHRDPEALMLVRALEGERAALSAPRSGALRIAASVAAVLLVAIGAWWFTSGERGQPQPQTLDARLVAAIDKLGQDTPEVFGDFQLLSGEELVPAAASRGGAEWIAPRGVLLAPPTMLRWKNPPGAKRVMLTVTGPGTRIEREVEAESLEVDALRPGRYVVTVRGLDTLAAQTIRRAFDVADDAARTLHASALDRIGSQVDEDLAPILRAHYALRHGLRARAAVEADRSTGDADVDAALGEIRRHLGLR